MAKATIENADCIKHIFQYLKIFTGLDLNENKSTLFFGKGANCKQQVASILNICIGNLPVLYLGILYPTIFLK